MKKRMAIQLYGHSRSFALTHQSLKNNIVAPHREAGYEVDLFIHTWDEKDCDYRSDLEPLSAEDIEALKAAYDPRAMLVEHQKATPPEKKGVFYLHRGMVRERPYKVMFNQLYTLRKANNLREEYQRETGVRYEIVLQTRMDISFIKPIRLDKAALVYEREKMNILANTPKLEMAGGAICSPPRHAFMISHYSKTTRPRPLCTMPARGPLICSCLEMRIRFQNPTPYLMIWI